jgi:hypothetical protein
MAEKLIIAWLRWSIMTAAMVLLAWLFVEALTKEEFIEQARMSEFWMKELSK